MEKIAIGIIGGTGGMGRWFARYLEGRGREVHVSGRTSGMGLEEMAARCQVVVVSVPIGATLKVIEAVGPLMKKDALLMDLTSLKAAPVAAMLKFSVSQVIGCHPLFGPKVESLQGRNIVLCPARTGKWLAWLREELQGGGALIAEVGPERHDQLMSVVQGLNHLNTIMMGLSLGRLSGSVSSLEGFTTPSFETKKGLLENIFRESPQLYAEIICKNPENINVIETYGQVLAELKDHVMQGDAEGLTGLIGESARRLWPADES